MDGFFAGGRNGTGDLLTKWRKIFFFLQESATATRNLLGMRRMQVVHFWHFNCQNMDTTSEKKSQYLELVQARKACNACAELGLKNPSQCCGGKYDLDHIGPWSGWQGNLDADLLVIGQEWGDESSFERQQGREKPDNATNALLIKLLAEIGVQIGAPEQGRGFEGRIFLTNAVLCLKKEGGLGGPVRSGWFDNCGKKFLRPLIELVRPKHVICLGSRAYGAVLRAYGLKRQKLRDVVTTMKAVELPGGALLYAVYHCGQRNQMFCRKPQEQIEDWRRLGKRVGSTRGGCLW